MSVDTLQSKKLGIGKTQDCPLCGMAQEIFIDGLLDTEDGKYMKRQKEMGYSFCNCRNIFFTDWKNINLNVYDQKYNDRYQRPEIAFGYNRQCKKFMPMLKEFNSKASTFLEIGSINDFILDNAQSFCFEPTGLDINSTRDNKNHKIIYGNIEDDETQEKVGKFDIIWMAHIFEHFKDPLKVARIVREKLNENGLLYVAMPDPYFIFWDNPYTWCHWKVDEHHILWDMDSFIDALIELGFDILYAQRHSGIEFLNTSGDFHLIFKKV